MDYRKLAAIQSEISCPKDKNNTFGKYKYRSCEDILEAAKKVLKPYSCSVVVSDELVMLGDRFYVKATARLFDEDGSYVENTAYAREPEAKKGMDEPQITGTCSSYARKYALNGLFALDDTKDPDTDEYKVESENRSKGNSAPESNNTNDTITRGQLNALLEKAYVVYKKEEMGDKMSQLMASYGYNGKSKDMPLDVYNKVMEVLTNIAELKNAG